MRLEKEYNANAGSWLGKILDSNGEPLASTWAASEEVLDKWYAHFAALHAKARTKNQLPADLPEPPKPAEIETEDNGEEDDKTRPDSPTRRSGRGR